MDNESPADERLRLVREKTEIQAKLSITHKRDPGRSRLTHRCWKIEQRLGELKQHKTAADPQPEKYFSRDAQFDDIITELRMIRSLLEKHWGQVEAKSTAETNGHPF